MKKVFLYMCCVVLIFACITGCGNTNATSEVNARYTTEGKETKLVPDKTATGELTVSVFGDKSEGNRYSIAQKIFNDLYPNVKLSLEITQIGALYDEYFTSLFTSIMAGKGPDIFWTVGGIEPQKLITSGAIADMRDFFEDDKYFNINDYNKIVFTKGQPDGTQYLIPLSYNIPIYLTTKSIITENNFNISNCKDYLGFNKEVGKLINNCADVLLPINNFYTPQFSDINSAGLGLFDLINNKVNVNNDKTKECFLSYKSSFEPAMKNPGETFMGADTSGANLLIDKKTFISNYSGSCFEGFIKAYCSVELVEEAVAIPRRDIAGKIQANIVDDALAVTSSSKNKENAYKFLKVMLSPEVQKIPKMIIAGKNEVPVSNIAVDKWFEEMKIPENFYIKGIFEKAVLPTTELINEYKGFLNEVTDVNYANSLSTKFDEIMKPYLEDKMTYDECIKNAQSALEIYVSE